MRVLSGGTCYGHGVRCASVLKQRLLNECLTLTCMALMSLRLVCVCVQPLVLLTVRPSVAHRLPAWRYSTQARSSRTSSRWSWRLWWPSTVSSSLCSFSTDSTSTTVQQATPFTSMSFASHHCTSLHIIPACHPHLDVSLARCSHTLPHISLLRRRRCCVACLHRGFLDLGAGLTCGLSGVASGWATAICGDWGVRAVCHQPKFFVGMILGLIFAGVMGLYGLIVALTMRTAAGQDAKCFVDCYNPCTPDNLCIV